MKTTRISAGVAAVVLVMAFAGTALAADPVYATVTGYAPATEDNNHEETWEEETGLDCEKIADGEGIGDSFVLDADYDLVIVKAGGSDNGNNTLFADASEGETVWADTNENGIFDPGGEGGDKSISHIIACAGEPEPGPTPTPTPVPTPTPTPVPTPTPTPGATPGATPTPTPENSVAGVTATPTLPPTDTLGGQSSAPGNSSPAVLLVVLTGIIASAYVLTPHRSRRHQ